MTTSRQPNDESPSALQRSSTSSQFETRLLSNITRISTSPPPPTSFSHNSLYPLSSRASPLKYAPPPLHDAVIAGLGLGIYNSDLPSSNSCDNRSNGGSMILYRIADDPRTSYQKRLTATGNGNQVFLPPQFQHQSSAPLSHEGDSTLSLSFTPDTSFPLSAPSAIPAMRGLVPYLYDPSLDSSEPIDDEDRLHDPTLKDFTGEARMFSRRGTANMAVLLLLISACLCLFVFYPIWTFVRDRARNLSIDGNIRVNATG